MQQANPRHPHSENKRKAASSPLIVKDAYIAQYNRPIFA
nr:MAG TPA: hypothetical protein [Caudoviricetes sp.]